MAIAATAIGQVQLRHATISSGGAVTADGSIIVLGQPIAGLVCAAAGSPSPCVHAGFVPLVVPPGGCSGDANGNGEVNFADITSVLENWNLTGPPGRAGDADGNGLVNFADISEVLTFWGVPCL